MEPIEEKLIALANLEARWTKTQDAARAAWAAHTAKVDAWSAECAAALALATAADKVQSEAASAVWSAQRELLLLGRELRDAKAGNP